uniref:Uncharacterized protein n=1 Tax=viral metagenome TaxID=1070528 RepID=A0A6C0JFA4_9ZZZZ
MGYIHDILINLICNNKYNFNLSVIVIITLSILILFAIINIIISYYIIKYLEINVANDIYFCNYNYNKKSEELLKKYGNYRIRKIYLVKNPVTKLNTFLLNLITFYNYEKTISNVNQNFKKKCTPCHISFMIEIELNSNNKKFLLLEKTSYVNISENIHLNEQKNLKIIKLPKSDFTINSILKETQNRIGEKKFFNWSIYKNNCSIFIKELLITVGLYNKSNIKFISQNKFVKKIKFTTLTLHIINILCTLNNVAGNYLYI